MPEINIIIQKFIQGNSSEEENQILYNWINQSPENKKRLFHEKDIWNTYAMHSGLKNYEVEAELELLKKQILLRTRTRIINIKRIIQLAAVLIIAFGLGWSVQFITKQDSNLNVEAVTQKIFVPKGQVNQIFLADGTRIWINSESHLDVPSVFAADERVVKLNGEAFFEVAKDVNRPFIVELNGQKIEVLGTSFNIRAYDNSPIIETTLQTGMIWLQTGKQKTVLKPGEQSVYDKVSNQIHISAVDPVTYSSWKDGRFVFQNEDLLEVFKVVERWYDVNITVDQNYFKGMHFSGVIKRNKDANHFLDLLNISIPINFKINGDDITITRK
jgi:ferric-dicitrate binding protein FerR (iron transport regulator)